MSKQAASALRRLRQLRAVEAFHQRITEMGARCMWEAKLPVRGSITAYLAGREIVLVQDYGEDHGYEVFRAIPEKGIEETDQVIHDLIHWREL